MQNRSAELTFEEAFEVADADAGSQVWGQCRACHALEAGRNGVGPYLHGVVDRDIASVDGFNLLRRSGAGGRGVVARKT